MNVVVFEVRRGLKMGKLVGEGRTRDPNCIRGVWSELQREHGVKASKVRRVCSRRPRQTPDTRPPARATLLGCCPCCEISTVSRRRWLTGR